MQRTEIKRIEGTVRLILTQSLPSRDNDNHLILKYLQYYGKLIDNTVSVENFLSAPPMESITRARRKLQKDNPELRGTKYKQRQNKQKDYIDYNRSK